MHDRREEELDYINITVFPDMELLPGVSEEYKR